MAVENIYKKETKDNLTESYTKAFVKYIEAAEQGKCQEELLYNAPDLKSNRCDSYV